MTATLTDTLLGIANAPDLARIVNLLADMIDLSQSLGWAAGWSKVKDDPTAAPIYTWLSECQAMRQGLVTEHLLDYRPAVTDMARRAVALFGDNENPEVRPIIARIRRGLGGALC